MNILDIFSKNPQISHFMKIRPVGTELLRAKKQTEGQAEMTKLIVASRNFAGAPKKFKSLQYAQRMLFVCFGIFSEKKESFGSSLQWRRNYYVEDRN